MRTLLDAVLGRPRLLVVLGGAAERLLKHVARKNLLPPLPPYSRIHHYSYLGSRAEGLGGRCTPNESPCGTRSSPISPASFRRAPERVLQGAVRHPNISRRAERGPLATRRKMRACTAR